MTHIHVSISRSLVKYDRYHRYLISSVAGVIVSGFVISPSPRRGSVWRSGHVKGQSPYYVWPESATRGHVIKILN